MIEVMGKFNQGYPTLEKKKKQLEVKYLFSSVVAVVF